MPRFLHTFAGLLPRYDVNEGLRVFMEFLHCTTALHYFAIIGTFAAVVFVVGCVTFSSAG